MNVHVKDGVIVWPGGRSPCAIGRSGLIAAADKREGDGATPVGSYPVRRAYYRPDRTQPPRTALTLRPTAPDDGWCDAPDDPAYNRPVRLPYPASCETLRREDGLYDLILVIGHNDDPPAPGAGSAIFVHCAAPDFKPTEGCVALPREDLAALISALRPGDMVEISGE